MRVLLDQGFPVPPGFKPSDVDATIEYMTLSKFAPELARESTPDWMVILAAAKGGFDAVAVDDQELKENQEILVALTYTKVSLVAWTQGIDPVTAWAQLVAYMPKIRQKIVELGPSIFILPPIRIVKEHNILKANVEVRRQASVAGMSYREVRSASVRDMRAELTRRNRLDLAKPLPLGRSS